MSGTKKPIDVATAMASLVKATASERRWDQRLGGAESRAYRDVAVWAVQRLVGAGAQLPDVLTYLRQSADLEA